MAGSLIVREPVFIEENGQRVAVILPIAAYDALRARAGDAEAQTLKPSLDAHAQNTSFEREKAAFERLKPKLIATYLNQYVAIVGGEVAAAGSKLLDVSEKVDTLFGRVPRYVQLVTDSPRIYHIPSRSVIER